MGPRVRWWVVTECSVFRLDLIVCVCVCVRECGVVRPVHLVE